MLATLQTSLLKIVAACEFVRRGWSERTVCDEIVTSDQKLAQWLESS